MEFVESGIESKIKYYSEDVQNAKVLELRQRVKEIEKQKNDKEKS